MGNEEMTLVIDDIPASKRSRRTIGDTLEEEYDVDNVDTWTWINYVAYWNKKLFHTFNTSANSVKLGQRNRGKYKGMIEPTMEHRGKAMLKDMIDFVFDNYQNFPKWSLQFELVCGSHYWSNFICEKVLIGKKNELKEVSW